MKPEITVVVAQGPSHDPTKRTREQEIADRLSGRGDWEVLVVPHLNDLRPDAASLAALRQRTGHLIVFSWLYPRAAHWILDRHRISGQRGTTRLQLDTDGKPSDEMPSDPQQEPVERVIDIRTVPTRAIYCIDLRACTSADAVLQEVERILTETGKSASRSSVAASEGNGSRPWRSIADDTQRRWYPVIDFARCTNCMECIDFCLFGVYGLDESDTILVEQPDNCRKGCPACSRVCPENAIIFPQHKSPAIAGASSSIDGLKVDLSQLFGKPEPDQHAKQIARQERDQQLAASANQSSSSSSTVPPSQDAPRRDTSDDTSDDLDKLINALDQFDL